MRDKDRIALSDKHNARGIELADHGMLDEAVREFRRAIELDPDSAHAYDNLGSVLAEKQLYREALSCYLTAIRLDPEAPTAHYNLATFLANHGLEMAAEEYREAIDLDPEYPDAHAQLAITYADQGLIDEAVQAFGRAIELEPDDPFPRYELAILWMEEGEPRRAVDELREVVKLDPEHFDAFLDLGICYTQLGFYDEAEKSFLRASELRADDVTLAYSHAGLHALRGRVEDGLRLLSQALAQEPDLVRSWLRHDRMFDRLREEPAFGALLHGAPTTGGDVRKP